MREEGKRWWVHKNVENKNIILGISCRREIERERVGVGVFDRFEAKQTKELRLYL